MRSLAAAALLLFSLAAPASASADVRLDPNKAGARSQLVVDAQPSAADGSSGDVRAIVLSAPRGLKFDPRSRAGRCSPQQAQDFACPESSRIGRGEAKGHASGLVIPGGRQDFTATLDAFLAPPREAGDLAAVVLQFSEPQSGQRGTSTGRVLPASAQSDKRFGVDLRFDDFGGSSQPQYPGVTIAIDRITLNVGAKRTVVRKRHVRRHGRRVTVRKRVRYSLLTNPRACTSGTWPFRVTTEHGDGSSDPQDSTLACTRR